MNPARNDALHSLVNRTKTISQRSLSMCVISVD